MSVYWKKILKPRGKFQELGILLSCLVIITCWWFFIEICDQIIQKHTRSFDEYVLTSLRQSADSTKLIGP
jgi:hypothetical protein